MVVGAQEFDGVLLLAALGQRCLNLGGRLGHGLIHALDGHGGTLRNRGDDHRLSVLGQARGQARLGLCGVTVAGSLEQIGNHRFLRREAKAARVSKAQTARGDQNEQKQHNEDFETRVAMATTDLGLFTILTVLLDHLGLGQRKETGVRGIGHKLTGRARRIERIDGRSVHRGRRGHSRLGG